MNTLITLKLTKKVTDYINQKGIKHDTGKPNTSATLKHLMKEFLSRKSDIRKKKEHIVKSVSVSINKKLYKDFFKACNVKDYDRVEMLELIIDLIGGNK